MIDGVPIVAMGPSALLSLVVLLILTDRLVWYKRLRVLEQRIAAQEELIGNLTRQNSMLLGSAIPTVNSVLNALDQAARGDTT
jgi:hypothetical protein